MGKRAIGVFVFVVLGVAGLQPAWGQEPPAPQGPVAYWKFDETTGTTAANSVAGAPAGTYQGGVAQSTTVPTLSYPNPRSLSFNGTNAVINVPQFGTFTNMSVSLWVQRAGHTGQRATLFSYKEAAGGGFVLSNNEDTTNDYPRIWLHQGGWQNKEDTASAVQMGVWTHLAATYTSGSLRIYRDGADVTPSPATQPTGNMTNPAGVTGIGARSSLNQHWFNGLIDDVRVWSRAITATEVQILYLGCPAPSGLTATAGNDEVVLNWSAPGTGPAYTYAYNVKRGTAPGVYTQVFQGVTGTTYTDKTVVGGTQYYYAVSATSAAESGNTNEVLCGSNMISVSPVTGLQTSENLGTAQFTITLNAPVPAGETVSFTIQSSNGAEGQVSGGGQAQATTIMFNATAPAGGWPIYHTIPITVTGVDDPVVDPATPYTVSVAASSVTITAFNGIAIPNVQLTNQDNDTAAIVINQTSGLITTESGGQATFTVSLTTQPSADVTMTVTSGNTLEGNVSTNLVTFRSTPGGVDGWNVSQVVTITGQDDTVLDFTVPYTIVTGNLSSSDGNYNGIVVPDIQVVNLDNETVPTLAPVWGGGSGGCGLLGAELLLPLSLVALRRRRRSR